MNSPITQAQARQAFFEVHGRYPNPHQLVEVMAQMKAINKITRRYKRIRGVPLPRRLAYLYFKNAAKWS